MTERRKPRLIAWAMSGTQLDERYDAWDPVALIEYDPKIPEATWRTGGYVLLVWERNEEWSREY